MVVDEKLRTQNELSEAALNAVLKLHSLFAGIRSAIDPKLPVGKEHGGVIESRDVETLKAALLLIFKEADFTDAISNTGIPTGSSFTDEALKIVKGNILPYLRKPNDVCTIIHEVFDQSGDYEKIERLLALHSEPGMFFTDVEKEEILSVFLTQLTNAIHIISYNIAALGVDEDVYTRAGKDDALITPFIEQNHGLTELLSSIKKDEDPIKIREDLAHTRVMIKHCLENIALIDKAAEKYGASLRQTFLLRKLELLITRLNILLPIICYDNAGQAFDSLLHLLEQITLAETRPKRLKEFISRNINMIAYRITENKGKTGEHYVASDSYQYWDLFISACGGGFIVSIMVIIKLMIHNMHLPLLWEGLLYSINYAVGFVVIHMLSFTLATKQPAMTAAFLAASLDDIKDDNTRYRHLAVTVASVSRSQLVSFAGNLIVVFPCAWLWILAITDIGHQPLIQPEAANELLLQVHPFYSLSFWYASIAGAFLFIAGIISGFGDNKAIVSSIGLRIAAHPVFKKRLTAQTRQRIGQYIERNLGPLLGNIILGFLLGMVDFIANITGLPFHIRHITFSAGNIALGFYGSLQHQSIGFVLLILLGIFIIGFFNFAISFFLALQIALRSRGLKLGDYPGVVAGILSHFKNNPLHFFFPVKRGLSGL